MDGQTVSMVTHRPTDSHHASVSIGPHRTWEPELNWIPSLMEPLLTNRPTNRLKNLPAEPYEP